MGRDEDPVTGIDCPLSPRDGQHRSGADQQLPLGESPANPSMLPPTRASLIERQLEGTYPAGHGPSTMAATLSASSRRPMATTPTSRIAAGMPARASSKSTCPPLFRQAVVFTRVAAQLGGQP